MIKRPRFNLVPTEKIIFYIDDWWFTYLDSKVYLIHDCGGKHGMVIEDDEKYCLACELKIPKKVMTFYKMMK